MIGTSTRFESTPPATRTAEDRKAHDVAESEDERHRVEREDHPRLIGERLHTRHELQVHELAPHLEGGHEKVVYAREPGGLQEQLRL